jgi:hypothetical protein
MPTQRTLEHFIPKLQHGGFKLIGHYVHNFFSKTRGTADDCHKKSNGLLLPLPTDQAIFFKH